jgi:hypothetical protein
MTTKEALDVVLHELPEERLSQLLDFARFLSSRDEAEAWQQFGRMQLAKAYGPDEPDYTLDDVKGGSSDETR